MPIVLQTFLIEWKIRKVLKRIARQRVLALRSHPITADSVWVIQHALHHSPETADTLATCRLRGWIEILDNAIPAPSECDNEIVDIEKYLDLVEPLYKLTSSGWDVIHRRQSIMVIVMILSTCSTMMAAAMLMINIGRL